jgi:exosortase F-associated protein
MKLRILDIAGIAVLAVMLVMVRFYEQDLFYDPLLPFFKTENKVLPEYDSLKLFFNLAFRYMLNTLLSLGILWLAFKDKNILMLSAILYLVLFVVLMTVLSIALNAESPNLLLIFYVRRFLIQALFLILFLPAFYYQKRMK